MRVVLDTNIIISALIYGGKPRAIFELIVIDRAIIGITSEVLLNEAVRILKTKFLFSQKRIGEISGIIKTNFTSAKNIIAPKIISADPFDNQVLAAAESGRADYIVSGDRHLLTLKKYESTKIISPTVFLEEIL